MTRVKLPRNVPGSMPRESILWVTSHDRRQLPAPGGLLHRRFRQAADLAWLPIDVVLAARGLSNLVIMAVTVMAGALSARADGVDGLIINLPGLAVVWGAACALIRLGRWWRGVHPPEHVLPPRRR